MMASRPRISTSATRARPRSSCRRPRRCASAPGSSPTPWWCCRSSTDSTQKETLVMALTPLRPGDPAPHFTLPAVNREGQVSLDDYRGRTPVLVALFRGLHCPFCRRQLVHLGTTQDKLKEIGVETVAVVNTPPERARLYYKYRPAKVLLGADPEAATHQAFRLPAGVFVEDESA